MAWRWLAGLLALAAGSLICMAAESNVLTKGTVVFQAAFEAAEPLAGWSGLASIELGSGGSKCVALSASGASSNAVITRQLPVEAWRGCRLLGSARVRADSISPKPDPWNGIKFMLIIQGPGGVAYPQAPLDVASFDWRRASFSASIPADATNLVLVLGLERVTGKVWFDDLKITVARVPNPGPVRISSVNDRRIRSVRVA